MVCMNVGIVCTELCKQMFILNVSVRCGINKHIVRRHKTTLAGKAPDVNLKMKDMDHGIK